MARHVEEHEGFGAKMERVFPRFDLISDCLYLPRALLRKVFNQQEVTKMLSMEKVMPEPKAFRAQKHFETPRRSSSSGMDHVVNLAISAPLRTPRQALQRTNPFARLPTMTSLINRSPR